MKRGTVADNLWFYNREMPQNQAALRTALRVLTAITDRTFPDEADLEKLRLYAPEFAHLPPDQSACAVIQSALKARGESDKAHDTTDDLRAATQD
jgi:hypothetical protein